MASSTSTSPNPAIQSSHYQRSAMTLTNVTNATQAEVRYPAQMQDSPFPDPKGWTSNPSTLESITCLLAGTVDAKDDDIQNILEQTHFDHYIFSYNNHFYLFTGGSGNTYQVERPHKQKELWDALKNNDWRKHLTLKELAD
ncbi:hypothetical protein OG21DRAFT_1487079 [Imleria badia]|nr:hypothetical protein OG21DRAFT_1487079 [Imleria badia]